MKMMIIIINFCMVASAFVSCGSTDDGAADSKTVAEDTANVVQYDGYKLVWHDEFSVDGKPSAEWNFENGFVRNEELQWYTKDNASVQGGNLVIEGRHETVDNPNYVSGSASWKTNRSKAYYTSSCMTTYGSFHFRYGRVEVRAKIPTARGSWPAIWTLGNKWAWPDCGEVDMMEFYLKDGVPSILANACWGSDRKYNAVWIPVIHRLLISRQVMLHGQANSISGVWTGMRRPLPSIWTANCSILSTFPRRPTGVP